MFDSFMIEKLMLVLNQDLKDRHIQRVWAFSREHFVFKMSSTQYLNMRFSAEDYHISLLAQKPEGESLQNAFLMALKKHLENGKILSFEQLKFDRTIHLVIQARNNVQELVQYHLYAEMMGRHSNLILCDEKQLVIQALKYSDLASHQIQMGYPYTALLSDKADPFVSDQFLDEQFMNYKGFHKGLIKLLPVDIKKGTYRNISHWIMQQEDFCLYLKQNFPYDYHLFKNNELSLVETDNLYSMLNTFYAQRKRMPQDHSRTGNLTALLYRRLSQLEDKLHKLAETSREYADLDKFKNFADLIYANLYRIRKGDVLLRTYDFNGVQEIDIPLDPRKTPSQNAQSYYERYQKMQRGIHHVNTQLQLAKTEKDTVGQMLYDLSQYEDVLDLDALEYEMKEMGLIKKAPRKPVQKSVPRIYDFQGNLYYIGRNSTQNEKLAFQTKNRNFVWFHSKDIPGSHVVLHKSLDLVNEEELKFGAKLAAYYSKASLSENTPVDYVKLSQLRKPKGTLPGFVTYVGQKTLYVTPDLQEIKQYEK